MSATMPPEPPNSLLSAKPKQASEVIEATAGSCLHHSAYLEIRHVKCHFAHGILQLRGYVSSYYLRQIAQTLVQGLEGVEAIDNQLEVIPAWVPRYRN